MTGHYFFFAFIQITYTKKCRVVSFKLLEVQINYLVFLTDPSQRHAPLSYCRYVWQAMPLSRHMLCSHAVKIHRRAKRTLTTCWQARQSRLLLIWNKVLAFRFCIVLRISNNKYRLWLFNVLWQIAIVPEFKWHVIIHEINMREHQEVF